MYSIISNNNTSFINIIEKLIQEAENVILSSESSKKMFANSLLEIKNNIISKWNSESEIIELVQC